MRKIILYAGIIAIIQAPQPSLAYAPSCEEKGDSANDCATYTWSDSLNGFECSAKEIGTCSCYTNGSGTSTYNCVCNGCSNCNSSEWENYGTGYQRRNIAYCSCNSCSRYYSYRCAEGYYGTTSNGTSGCTRCPASGGIYGMSAAGSTTITACYIPSGTGFSDSTGSGIYTENCYYKN
ncbi:MAG: hypothetical protein K2I81_02605 [Alphaproteobacteria bacterium]|nr:hypothetical protein [Alphaproteobacteria bacterium]